AKELWRTTINGRWIDEEGRARPFEDWGLPESMFLALDEDVRRLARERMATDFREHGRWWVNLLTVGQLRYDVNQRLGLIRAPTLLLYGERADEFLQRRARQIVTAIPDARLEFVPLVRVTSAFDQPELYARLVLDFLASVTEAAPSGSSRSA